ncbi:hypothetical protein NH44784_052401 [Achromobacter xylosoxidans NH44784-1996]|nr:hypothetical protein NH44784_052401 [Achromobacter xylosoxidans NH44784-1996]
MVAVPRAPHGYSRRPRRTERASWEPPGVKKMRIPREGECAKSLCGAVPAGPARRPACLRYFGPSPRTSCGISWQA